MAKVYRKPMRTGWTLLAVGVLGVYAGVKLVSATNDDGFFALAALGLVFAVAGVATLGVYGAMERGVARTLRDTSPLLRFTIPAQDFAAFASAQAEEIRATNKASLVIVLIFCGLMAVLGPLVADEGGIIYTFTGVAIALFLTGVFWAATRYRVQKLATADKEVVVTTGSAWIGGQFHVWTLPASFLSEVTWFDAGTYEHSAQAAMRITYHALTRTIVTPYTFVIPVPAGLEEQAKAAADTLRRQIKLK